MLEIIFIAVFAFANRCRGSQFFGDIPSTTLSRILAAGMMAVIVYMHSLFIGWGAYPASLSIVVSWILLDLWMVPGWDTYWAAEFGRDALHTRLWGLGMMTLRMSAAMPAIEFLGVLSGHGINMLYALGALTLGIPYYIAGYALPDAWRISVSECAVGALLGVFCLMAMG